MAAKPRIKKLTKRSIDAAHPMKKRYIIWDEELKGFGLRVETSGVKSLLVRYRPGGGRKAPLKQITLGRFGVLSADQARMKAKSILGKIADGGDPMSLRNKARGEMTIAELCALYFLEGTGTKKETTLASDDGRVRRHINPLLGRRQISTIVKADVERFMRDVAKGKTAGVFKTGPRGRAVVRGGKGTATKAVGLLGAIFTFAVDRGLVPINPVRGVKRYPDNKNQNYLSLDDLRRLGKVLDELEAEGSSPTGIACIKLLALTGARKSEITKLRWENVDFANSYIYLDDSKTGAKIIPLGRVALKVLSEQPRLKNVPWVFPSDRAAGETNYQGIEKIWHKVRVKLDMPKVRIHDLRHSFAAVGATSGHSLPIIGAILGHREVSTTQRYAHLADLPVKQATNTIADKISAAMTGKTSEPVDIDVAAAVDKTQIVQLITNLQALLKSA
ncbi:MAG: site-specific integrase [Paracoccaceae bacterium]